MEIYISWSGQASYRVAVTIRALIRALFPGMEVWVSSEDIQDGARWSIELIRILERTSFKILCADPSNRKSNWFNFEVGAIAKSTDKWNIKVFLYELSPSDLQGPMSQYQTVRLDRDDVRRMFEDIHANIPAVQISKEELVQNLTNEWPDFQKNIKEIHLGSTRIATSPAPGGKSPQADVSRLEYIDEVDEKILTLLFINEGIDEERIATTVYLGRGECLKHLIDMERKELVWSNLSFGTRRWYVTEKGKKYLPGVYQGYGTENNA